MSGVETTPFTYLELETVLETLYSIISFNFFSADWME